jgi:hypothetical protein
MIVSFTTFVMAGLAPAIHVFSPPHQDVDARRKAGHDEKKSSPT